MQIPSEKDARACGCLECKGKAGHKLRRRDEVSGLVQSYRTAVLKNSTYFVLYAAFSYPRTNKLLLAFRQDSRLCGGGIADLRKLIRYLSGIGLQQDFRLLPPVCLSAIAVLDWRGCGHARAKVCRSRVWRIAIRGLLSLVRYGRDAKGRRPKDRFGAGWRGSVQSSAQIRQHDGCVLFVPQDKGRVPRVEIVDGPVVQPPQ